MSSAEWRLAFRRRSERWQRRDHRRQPEYSFRHQVQSSYRKCERGCFGVHNWHSFSPAAFAITTTSLPSGQVGVAYNATLGAIGRILALYLESDRRRTSGRSDLGRGDRHNQWNSNHNS